MMMCTHEDLVLNSAKICICLMPFPHLRFNLTYLLSSLAPTSHSNVRGERGHTELITVPVALGMLTS